MKSFLLISIFILPLFAFSQRVSKVQYSDCDCYALVKDIPDCKDSIDRAKTDARAGNVTWHYFAGDSREFNFRWFLQLEYNIKSTQYRGKDTPAPHHCYGNYMNAFIEKNYGSIEELKQKHLQLSREGKAFTLPKYFGRICQEISTYIDWNSLPAASGKVSVTLSFTLGADANVYDPKVTSVSDVAFGKAYADMAVSAISRTRNWWPANYKGKTIPYEITWFKIKFNRKERTIHIRNFITHDCSTNAH